MKLERVAFALGLGLLAWLIHRVGIGVILANVARVGWGFVLLLAFESLPLLLATLGWRATRSRLRRVPFRSLLGMRLAGDAFNSVAPAAVVGGEIVRGRLLARWLSPADVVGSVSLAAMAQFIAQVLFVALGALVVPAAGLQPRLRLVGVVLLALIGLFIALLLRLSRLRPRPGTKLARFLQRLDSMARGRLSDVRLLPGLRRSLSGALGGRGGNLAISVLFFLGAWGLSAVEVFLILGFLGASVSPGTCLSIAVLMVAVEGIFFFVPARAGVAEGGLYAVFSVLGLDPAIGLSLALVRRLRELTWAGAGLAILGLTDRIALLRPAPEVSSPREDAEFRKGRPGAGPPARVTQL